MGTMLDLGGIASAELKTPRAPDAVSLSPGGQIFDKKIVSEVTTVQITSRSAYTVKTESPAEAASNKGADAATVPGADGSVNVVAADDSQKSNNSGSISVESTVTYSDGSTQKSAASLSDTFVTSGNGLARQRLEAIVGGALSETAILAKLGIAQPDSAAATAASAPSDVGVDAAISSNIAVSLTYLAQGDQRTVTGVETGGVKALIATFDPTQRAYGANGALSTTKESMSFSGSISGGSSFSARNAAWLIGSVGESTSSLTTIAGANQITIARQSTVDAQFATTPAGAFVHLDTSNSTQYGFAAVVDDGKGAEREQITLGTSDASSNRESVDENGVVSGATQHAAAAAVWIGFTPVPPSGTLLIENQPLLADA